MAAIISHFEGSFSPNRIEVEGEAIPLAIIKTTTDWATVISSFLCIPSTIPVNARIFKGTSFGKKFISLNFFSRMMKKR